MLTQKGVGGGVGSFNGFRFAAFIDCFLSDVAASTAVKGLMSSVKVDREIKSEIGLPF